VSRGPAIWQNAHLRFLSERPEVGCIVCHRRFGPKDLTPACEVCGAVTAHLECYRTKIARERLERQWWDAELSTMTEEEDVHIIFLCPGCRS
jgi:Zn finger protein HypA/HybF involved in hydrogenase expression